MDVLETPLCTNVSQSGCSKYICVGAESRSVVMRQNDKCALSNNLTSLQQKKKKVKASFYSQ